MRSRRRRLHGRYHARGDAGTDARLHANPRIPGTQRAAIGAPARLEAMTFSRWSLPRRQCLRLEGGWHLAQPHQVSQPHEFHPAKVFALEQRLEHILSYSLSPTLSPSIPSADRTHSDSRWSQLRFRAELPELPTTRTLSRDPRFCIPHPTTFLALRQVPRSSLVLCRDTIAASDCVPPHARSGPLGRQEIGSQSSADTTEGELAHHGEHAVRSQHATCV